MCCSPEGLEESDTSERRTTTTTTKGQKEKSKEKLLRELHRERLVQIQRSQLSQMILTFWERF